MDSMDLDHDMDVDVDLVPDEPIVAEPDKEDRSDGEVDDDPDAPAPTKVHIRGLDMMNPNDVKAYVAQHCAVSDVAIVRIEWVDDTSANLVFADDALASRALQLLASSPADHALPRTPPRAFLPAKPWADRPEIQLQVRPALESDKKQVGAAQRSRFYLLNPEYDAEERRRRTDARRYRDRQRGSFSRRRSRDDDTDEPFDVSLYDDGPAVAVTTTYSRLRRRRSYTPDSDADEARRDSYRSSNRGKELFPNGSRSAQHASRDRSASPRHVREGDRDMDGSSPGETSSTVARDRNRHRAHAIKSHISRQNRSKELFPTESKATSANGRLGDRIEDATALLARGITLPLMDDSSDVLPAGPGRKVEDRVPATGQGRLAARVSGADAEASSFFNIRGVASQKDRDRQGFAIKGGAGKSVKELFPDKFGSNAGKELFADGAGGRPRQRRKAGDLFD
ncbi:hypothetical protein F5Y18DRAFT_365349 [Xylariaceae sp. FL1019]|nr:hypothetical protein F5Y18DRAFT_365349 [Xylariaceae sp. FL1019]